MQIAEYKLSSCWIPGRRFPNKAAISSKFLQKFPKTTLNIFRIKVAEYKLKSFRIRRWPPVGGRTAMLH